MTIRTKDELANLLSKTEFEQSPYLPTRFVPKFVSLIDEELKTDLSTDKSRRDACEMVNIWLKEHDYKCEGFRSKTTDSVMHEITVSYHENVRSYAEANKGIMGKDSFGFQFKDADDHYNDWIFIAWELLKGGEANPGTAYEIPEPPAADDAFTEKVAPVKTQITNYEYLMANKIPLKDAVEMWNRYNDDSTEHGEHVNVEFQNWLDQFYKFNAGFTKFDVFILMDEEPMKLYMVMQIDDDCYEYVSLDDIVTARITDVDGGEPCKMDTMIIDYTDANRMRKIGHMEFNPDDDLTDE